MHITPSPKITPIPTEGYEQVLRIEARDVGLVGYIAIHSTQFGPAAGGLRMRPYDSEADALEDVLRLARGMTYKNAAVGLPLGGGKAVILGDPGTKSQPMLRAMGRAIDSLGGRYVTAEDMGMTPADMAAIRSETPYVAGLAHGPHASGDPSPITARGIFQSIRTAAQHRLGSPVLAGRRIALQGLGHVGWELAKLLRAAGADLIVADADPARAAWAKTCFGADLARPDAIIAAEADIFAPCAIGGVLNAETIPRLKVSVAAGAANNQLASAADGTALAARGILYAPDYIVNAGGIINVAAEILKVPNRRAFVAEKLAELDATLAAVFTEAARLKVGPDAVADAIVAARMHHPEAA